MPKFIQTAAAVATAIVGVTFAGCSSGGGGGDIASVGDTHITRAAFDNRLESSRRPSKFSRSWCSKR